jgi:hypothetical protein
MEEAVLNKQLLKQIDFVDFGCSLYSKFSLP